MVFHSFRFLLFFPVVVIAYYAVPQRMKNAWLVLASYFFYACCSVRTVWVLLAATLVTYLAALAVEPKAAKSRGTRARRLAFWAALLAMLGMLAVFKYVQFAISNANAILGRLALGRLDLPGIAMPVGISFFTFQAVGYLIDVYRGQYPAARNFVDYALFVSFFPQLLSGPIGRGGALLPQYRAARRFDLDGAIDGGLRFLWGLMMKLILSDRAAILVDTVFDNHQAYTGMAILVAALAYALQIYTDFGGYSLMAQGCAQMLGIALPQNFRQPYFAVSIRDFWRRWHISLSTWLRDYVYIPLGGSRCAPLRRQANVMATFLVSGIWHGASWSYVAWGLLHGLYQVAGSALAPVGRRLAAALRIRTDTAACRACRMIVTFVLVLAGWVIFRASSLMSGLRMLARIALRLEPFSLGGGALYELGLDRPNFTLLLVGAGLLLAVDIAAERGVDMRRLLRAQNGLFKVCAVALSILAILLLGVWGNAYDAASFIYFKF